MNKNLMMLDSAVKQILLKEWDPIGVGDVPEAQDEYDSYVSAISRMIRDGKAVDELYAHLRWIECERIGLDGDEAHTRNIANRLVKLG